MRVVRIILEGYMVVAVVVIGRKRVRASHRQPTIRQRFSKAEITAHDVDD